MRLSQFPLFTTKETPADAEIVSHQLMLRTGMIRRLASGLYTWLPLGLRVLRKVEAIVREEMNRAGALEVAMPTVQPAELWQESGRWEVMGDEMLRLKDRHERDFCYAPTAEEVITDLVRGEYKSYKQLPVNFYQIGTKFRDERRPRFGVMRAREFLMKDAYSFHVDKASLAQTYADMRVAYTNIFTRLGVEFRVVQADPGNIGGSASEEFHVLASSGEDLLAIASGGSYAANIEAAVAPAPSAPRVSASEAMKKVPTPGKVTCAEVAEFLKLPIERTVKSVAVEANGKHFLLLLRGDHEANLVKIGKLEGLSGYRLANEAELGSLFKSVAGYIGPVGLGKNVSIVADQTVAAMSDFVCGANEKDHHLSGINWGRDLPEPTVVADIRNAVVGESAPDGQGTYQLVRGIEVGHIFQLGLKYSTAMKLGVLDAGGQTQTPEMGCYGIGVTRIVGAVIEQRHDNNGIIWPESIAPFRVILCPIGISRSPRVKETVEQIYAGLLDAGIDAVLDDRDLRPGVMFAEADLVGIPHRVVIGDRGLEQGMLEYKHRRDTQARNIPNNLQAVLEALRVLNMQFRRQLRILGFGTALAISILSVTAHAQGQGQAPEPGLRKALDHAVKSSDSFQDRFQAEVWLLDMSNRLQRFMPDTRERLDFLRAVHRESRRAKLPPELVLSVIDVESRFDRFAVSRSGAQGYMQVMKFWVNEIGRPQDNLIQRDTNLRYGCAILRYYLDVEKNNLIRALARYNGSLGKPEYPNLVLGALKRRWYRS